MTPEEKAAKDMLFIAPYDYEGVAGWLVRISWYPDGNYEHRKWHSKLLNNSKTTGDRPRFNTA